MPPVRLSVLELAAFTHTHCNHYCAIFLQLFCLEHGIQPDGQVCERDIGALVKMTGQAKLLAGWRKLAHDCGGRCQRARLQRRPC